MSLAEQPVMTPMQRVVTALTCASALVACGPGPSVDGPGPTLAEPATSATPPSAAPEGTTEPSPSASVRVSDALGRATTVTSPGGADAPEAALVDGVVVVSATLGDGEALEVTVDGARWTAYPDGSATLTDGYLPLRSRVMFSTPAPVAGVYGSSILSTTI